METKSPKINKKKMEQLMELARLRNRVKELEELNPENMLQRIRTLEARLDEVEYDLMRK